MKMKKRLHARIQILFFLLFISSAVLAQKKIITGKVTDVNTGAPLQGVSVVSKGTSSGTTTGSDGTFKIQVGPEVKVLVFSSVGFGIHEATIKGESIFVSLSPINTNLNDIVVIGYGTAKKKDLTGSISTVNEKDFQKGVIISPDQLIVGKVAGVSVVSNSGQPGAGSTIRIRGGSSLNASNDPLIVIDGIPISNEIPPGQTNAVAGASSPLSFINPNDIESFTVLKDASASAIYGTRAANGVIIITTKKGRGGNLRINFNTLNSVSTIPKKVAVLSADQFRSIVKANGTPAQAAMLGTSNTNWQDQIYQTALGTTNNISVSGGIKSLPYRLSIGYQNQNGILKTDNLTRTSATLALNPSFFDNHLKVNLNLMGSLENTRFGNQTAIGAAISFDPTQPVYSGSSRFGGYYEWLDPTAATGLRNLVVRNPLGILEQSHNTSTPSRSIGNIQLDYQLHFLPELHAIVNAGYDYANGEGKTFTTDSAASSYIAGGTGGQNNPYKQVNNNKIFEFYLNYVKDIKSINSRIDVTAGYSYNDYLTTVYNYSTYYADGSKVANSTPAYPFDKPEHTLISYFGRLNYSYQDRYLLTATLRRDGSSRFGPDNKWGLFPSAAVAWNINDEEFLRNSQTISSLRLRIGYGITGQQDGIPNYAYLADYSLSDSNAAYQFGNSYYQGYRPTGFNPSLKWEQTATTNIGIDFGFLNNRISGSIEFYQKKTSDLLNNIPQPAGSNFSAFFIANVGDMTNKGVEFTINAQPIREKNLTWDIGFNISYNKNNITNLTVIPNDTSYIGFPSGNIAGGIGGQFAFINAVGTPKNTFYLYQQVYDKNGRPIEGVFTDKNGDGIINQSDLYKGHKADPTVYFGFSTNVNYKNWNAGFILRASFGNYNYNNIYSQTGNLNQILGNAVIYNASSNYLTTLFKGGNNQQLLSDYYVQNASFLRMDNFSVGYNFGQISKSKLTLQITAVVQNVFVITKYTGLDPEIAANAQTAGNPGIDNNLYPRPRVFALGLNLGF
jgi:TonB-dependent starch-binding outer membrane protein SusC